MARHVRVEFPGAIYHVTCRMLGDARSRLFKEDADYERYLLRLSERVEQYNIRLYMYVCMRNHVHLVLETPEGNLSQFMQSISTAYTVYYNLRHERHGHLFDGRFKAKLVDGDNYLLALSRYVHLNPIKVAGVKTKPVEERIAYLRRYRWSSYPGYIDVKRRLEFVEYSPVSALMGGDPKRWPGLYRRYVEDGLDVADREFLDAYRVSPRCIGGGHFVSRVDEMYHEITGKYTSPEDVTFRRVVEPLDSESVFSVIVDVFKIEKSDLLNQRRDYPLRGIAALLLLKYCGLTQRQIAGLLKIRSGSTVSKQIALSRKLIAEDEEWNRPVRKCKRILSEMRVSAQLLND